MSQTGAKLFDGFDYTLDRLYCKSKSHSKRNNGKKKKRRKRQLLTRTKPHQNQAVMSGHNDDEDGCLSDYDYGDEEEMLDDTEEATAEGRNEASGDVNS